jgi:hypothetical protein
VSGPFLIIGLFLGATIFVVQRRGLSWIVRGPAGAALLLACALVMYLNTGPETLSDSTWYDVSPSRELLLFALMSAGMACRYLTRQIERRSEKIRKLERASGEFDKPRIEFDAWEFSYPFFVSVVTFAAVLSQIQGEHLGLADVILSFQTGFFWQTVLASRANAST